MMVINADSIITIIVFSNVLCPLHLSLQHSGPEIKWVDAGKPLFKLSTHLVSSVYTQVQ